MRESSKSCSTFTPERLKMCFEEWRSKNPRGRSLTRTDPTACKPDCMLDEPSTIGTGPVPVPRISEWPKYINPSCLEYQLPDTGTSVLMVPIRALWFEAESLIHRANIHLCSAPHATARAGKIFEDVWDLSGTRIGEVLDGAQSSYYAQGQNVEEEVGDWCTMSHLQTKRWTELLEGGGRHRTILSAKPGTSFHIFEKRAWNDIACLGEDILGSLREFQRGNRIKADPSATSEEDRFHQGKALDLECGSAWARTSAKVVLAGLVADWEDQMPFPVIHLASQVEMPRVLKTVEGRAILVFKRVQVGGAGVVYEEENSYGEQWEYGREDSISSQISTACLW